MRSAEVVQELAWLELLPMPIAVPTVSESAVDVAARHRILQPWPETKVPPVYGLRDDLVLVRGYPGVVIPRWKADRLGIPASERETYRERLTVAEMYDAVWGQVLRMREERDRWPDGRRAQVLPWWSLTD